jgi:hypothetical protein
MLFLFDYGDGWLFRVTLRTIGKKSPPRSGTRTSSQRVARLLRNTPTMMTTPTTGRALESIPLTGKK